MDVESSAAATYGRYDDTDKQDNESSFSLTVSELGTSSGGSEYGSSHLSSMSKSKDAVGASTRMIRPAGRRSTIENELTINKLNFNFQELYGRDQEIQRLEEVLQTVKEQKTTKVIFLHGYSGVGKSALIGTLKRPTMRLGGLMARGKYDLNNRKEGYKGISSALENALSQISARREEDPELFQKVVSSIQQDLDSEISLVSRIVPILQEMNVCQAPTDESTETSDPASMETKNLYLYALKRLVQSLARIFSPFVLVLDDLQWADMSSLDVLESIAADEGTSGILLCGIYRSNEVDEKHYLSQIMRNLIPTSPQSEESRFLKMELGNLSQSAIQQLLSDVLSTSDESKTKLLAILCKKRTQGNIFFLLQFLEMLKDKYLLEFNFGMLSWVWDISEIEQKTQASDNVADLLKSKMALLSDASRLVLQVAACFGDSFNADTLSMVWASIIDGDEACKGMATADLNDILASLVKDGYLQRHMEMDYKFSHDKIQEAVGLLDNMVPNLGQRVGLILLDKMEQESSKTAITTVVDLLNEGPPQESDGWRIEQARLNLRACQYSASIASFEASANYAATGIECMGTDRWRQKDPTLGLYSHGAEAEGLLGRFETVAKYYKEVVSQTHLSHADKLRVSTAYCASLAGQGRPDAARRFATDVLKEFDCSFPKSKMGFLAKLAKEVVRTKKRIKNDAFSNLSKATFQGETDTAHQQVAFLLDKLMLFCYLCGHEQFLLVNFKALDRTLTYGLDDFSPLAFSGTAIALVSLGNVRDAGILARIALELASSSYPLDIQCRTNLNTYGFVLHWIQPMRQSIKPLVQAYDFGLRSGQTDNACYAILTFVLIRLLTSHSFHTQAEDLAVYTRQCRELKQEFGLRFLLMFETICYRVIEKSDDENRSLLFGPTLSKADVEKWSAEAVTFAQQQALFQVFLFALYGEHVKGAELALKVGADACRKTFPGSPMLLWDALFKGLSSFAAARSTKKRKYRKIGFVMYKRVKQWISQGNPNVNHIAALFEAEIDALNNKPYNAISKYEAAVLLSARSGFLIEAGICSERLADILLECGKEDDAKYRFGNAVTYYTEVGALEKARVLRKATEGLWPRPEEIVTY